LRKDFFNLATKTLLNNNTRVTVNENADAHQIAL